MSGQARPELGAWELSHGLLVAVLMSLGGSVVLDVRRDLGGDAMGNTQGVLYGVAMEPVPGGQVRLSVVARDQVSEEA